MICRSGSSVEPSDPIGVQPGAADQPAGRQIATAGAQHGVRRPGARWPAPRCRRRSRRRARRATAASVAVTWPKSMMPGTGHVQRPDPGRVWLDLAQLLGADHPQSGHPVGLTAAPRVRSSRSSSLSSRATMTLPQVSYAMPCSAAKRSIARLAVHAQLRLERAGLVVDAGVQDTTVVAALVPARRGLLLDHRDTLIRMPRVDLAGRRQADDAGAHDHDVVFRAQD